MYPICNEALELMNFVNNKGYMCYLVGGAVRNALLELKPCDYDFVTDASVDKLKEIFKDYSYKVYANKHTMNVKFNSFHFEITPIIGLSLDEDISRRDFTINSILYSSESGIIDKFNGVRDLKNKIIRAVNISNIFDDPIRILRALRFKAIYGFEIDNELRNKINDSVLLLDKIQDNKVMKEITPILLMNKPSVILGEYKQVFLKLIPKININRYEEMLKEIDSSCDILEIRLAILFDDFSDDILKSFGYNKDVRGVVQRLVEFKDYKLNKNNVKRFIYDFGLNYLDYIFMVKKAAGLADYDEIIKIANDLISSDELIFHNNLKIKSRHLHKLGYMSDKITIILNDVLEEVRNNKIINDYNELKNYILKKY